MCYSLKDIMSQADLDNYTTDLVSAKDTAYMLYGVKILQDKVTEQIRIYNTTKGGDYYAEITENEYEEFYKNGWRIGVYVLSLSNYRRKLTIVNDRIQAEISKKRTNKKTLSSLQASKKRILNNYSKFSKKLNQIKNKSND